MQNVRPQMKPYIWLWLGCFSLAIPTASAQDTTRQREEAATKLARYEIPRFLTDDMLQTLSRTLPAEQRSATIAFLRSEEVKDQLIRAVAPIYARHFTLEEIEALYRFSSSEIGQSIQRKYSAVYGDSVTAVQRELGPALTRFLQQYSERSK